MFRCFAKRHRKGEPKVIQNEVKIELWVARGPTLEVFVGFARGLIFDEFLIGLKIRKNPENRGGGAKRGSPLQGSAAEAGSPERLWSLLKRQESTESAKTFGTPCPLRAGGGGFTGYRHCRRPYGGWVDASRVGALDGASRTSRGFEAWRLGRAIKAWRLGGAIKACS